MDLILTDSISRFRLELEQIKCEIRRLERFYDLHRRHTAAGRDRNRGMSPADSAGSTVQTRTSKISGLGSVVLVGAQYVPGHLAVRKGIPCGEPAAGCCQGSTCHASRAELPSGPGDMYYLQAKLSEEAAPELPTELGLVGFRPPSIFPARGPKSAGRLFPFPLRLSASRRRRKAQS